MPTWISPLILLARKNFSNFFTVSLFHANQPPFHGVLDGASQRLLQVRMSAQPVEHPFLQCRIKGMYGFTGHPSDHRLRALAAVRLPRRGIPAELSVAPSTEVGGLVSDLYLAALARARVVGLRDSLRISVGLLPSPTTRVRARDGVFTTPPPLPITSKAAPTGTAPCFFSYMDFSLCVLFVNPRAARHSLTLGVFASPWVANPRKGRFPRRAGLVLRLVRRSLGEGRSAQREGGKSKRQKKPLRREAGRAEMECGDKKKSPAVAGDGASIRCHVELSWEDYRRDSGKMVAGE